MSQANTDFHTLLETVLGVLCEYPQRSIIEIHNTERAYLINIRVDPSDYGKVIGQGGEIAKALRTLLKAYSGKHRTKFLFEISSL